MFVALAAACGGGPAMTDDPATTGSFPTPLATPAISAQELCVLTAADWQQYGYTTGAEPAVSSGTPGTAICEYADGLFLEVYTEASAPDAADTFQTIANNVPIDEPVELMLPGTEQVVFDADTGDGNAGIFVQSGQVVYTISGLARESAQAELLALAALVLQRLPSTR